MPEVGAHDAQTSGGFTEQSNGSTLLHPGSWEPGDAAAPNAAARGYAELAFDILRKPGWPASPGIVWCRLASCLTVCGCHEAARALLDDAHSLAIGQGDALLRLRADVGLAESLCAQRSFAAAIVLGTNVLQSAAVLRDDGVEQRAQQLLFEAHQALGNLPQALAHLKQRQALRHARKMSLLSLQARLSTWRMDRRADERAKVRGALPAAMRAQATHGWARQRQRSSLDCARARSLTRSRIH